MNNILIYFVIGALVVCLINGFDFEEINADTTENVQESTVKEAIERLIPLQAPSFDIKVQFNFSEDGKDVVQILKNPDGKVLITASSGVAAASGFHHYLKYYCGCHISWDNQQLNIPEELPDVNETIKSNDRFRYYQNVCTTSYSFVWWNWNRWETHIDWMAFNGINLPLAFTGQEAIWLRVYRKFNLTDDEINQHFSGPAFLSWARMGNLRGWAGPLSANWHTFTVLLQHRILDRMRNFGMVPVLPSFAGHVPKAFKRLYPNSSMIELRRWNNFKDQYCCPYLVDSHDPLFGEIGKTFMEEYIAEFGTNHMYNCDPFNEMAPTNNSLEFLKGVSASIYTAMTKTDPSAIWVIQNWLFVHDFLFWTTERVETFLTAVPIGRMLVLDLQSEQSPKYKKFHSYFGQPFIWCMLHNFGGTLGMFGSVDVLNKEVFNGRSMENSTMVGIGLTPEGINQNYPIYEFMLEMGWRKHPVNVSDWFHQYSNRRYGESNTNAHRALDFLAKSVYNYTGAGPIRGKYVINRTPRLRLKSEIWYDTVDVWAAWDNMIAASDSLYCSPSFQHDLVDVTRQMLQIFGDEYYTKLVPAFRKKKRAEFRDAAETFLKIFGDLEQILASSKDFLLGDWLESAKSVATNEDEKKSYEYNARNQITLWGPRGEIHDYASKQWSGLVSHLFAPRWEMFIDAMNESLATGSRFNESAVSKKIFTEIERPFTFDRTEFPATPIGNSIEIARSIHKDWSTRVGRLTPALDTTPSYTSRDDLECKYNYFSTPDVIRT